MASILGGTVDDLLGAPSRSSSPASAKIPVLGSIPAGIPVEAVEEILDWEDIPPEWITGGREYFGLKVRGDSMYPKYLDGDTVILHEDGRLEIRPLDPDHSPRTFTSKEVRELPVTIAGVVVELRRKIK